MKRYIQHQDLKISHFTATRWDHPVHNHNHFEIIFIHRGKGQHCLSGHHYDYAPQNLFLLAPSDTHHFEIKEETEFTFLKFTNVYLDLSPLLSKAPRHNAALLNDGPRATRAGQLINLIVEEWKESMQRPNDTILHLMQALLSLLQQNMDTPLADIRAATGKTFTSQHTPADRKTIVHGGVQHAEKISAVLHYLHSNIHNPEYIQLEHLAGKFGFSRHYMGIFFKEQTGMPLREYVNQYKLTLIEHQLQYSSHSIKEISHEMGFTDQSHLNKFFRTHKGMSPSAYREGHTRQPTKTTHQD